jgi:hypothetical protein
VPSLQEETVNVKVVPDEAFTAKEHPVAVPALEKSPFATESTDCENAIEKSIGEEVFVGDVVAEENVVGVEKVRYLKTTIPEPPLPPLLLEYAPPPPPPPVFNPPFPPAAPVETPEFKPPVPGVPPLLTFVLPPPPPPPVPPFPPAVE